MTSAPFAAAMLLKYPEQTQLNSLEHINSFPFHTKRTWCLTR
jgi:hypothetical protein